LVNPHHDGPRCTRYAPGVKCAEREAAQASGEMFYSQRHGGWVYPAEDRMPPRALRDKLQAPFSWTFCPFCSGSLPDVESAVERFIKPPPREADPGAVDGEEGG
jgi:hypothetical protein